VTGGFRPSKLYWSSFVLWHLRRERTLPYRPMETLRSIQRRRIRSIVAHAYRYVPHYRETMRRMGLHPRDFETADDLGRLPLLTKDEVRATPDRFRSVRHPADDDRTVVVRSSGTSGRPFRVTYDATALVLALAHGHRQRLAMAPLVGRTTGYSEATLTRSNGPGLALRRFYETHAWTPGRMELERLHLSVGAPFEQNLARLNEFRPHVVRGYGSYLGAFFRWIRERGIPFARPRLVAYGADSMADTDRALIETELGIPVWSSYQAAEALRIAFQCERRQGYHVSLDAVAVRTIDDHGDRVAPGEAGSLVLSNLTNRATVLLNFKLGDVVTWSQSPCPCGRTLPAIEHIQGRSDDLVLMPDGSVIHGLAAIERMQRVPGVVQVQLIQEGLRRFSVRAVCADDAAWASVHAALEAALSRLVGADAEVRTVRLDRIPPGPGGKVRAVISHCGPRGREEPGPGPAAT
jgi:phenylacetate-CoA ligase